MSLRFEEIAFCSTAIGELVLQKRRIPQVSQQDIYEIKLGDEYLMTSLFHEAEDQLAHLAIASHNNSNLNVVVGGLGLGYTAIAALKSDKVSKLTVIEYLKEVIEWHEKELVPTGKVLNQDPRCQFQHSSFFDLKNSLKMHDMILLDIDHRPDFVLHSTNSEFYTKTGLSELSSHLNPKGIFAMWADGKPQSEFVEILNQVFVEVKDHTIEFANPINGTNSFGTVYVACKESHSD